MSLQKLLDQFAGSGNAAEVSGSGSDLRATIGKLSSGIPGGLAGGAAAGGIMALLMGNKSARKFAGKAATVGGAAVLGGLAYRAYQQWQNPSTGGASAQTPTGQAALQQESIAPPQQQQPASDLTIIKAMISAAKADGHIDDREQQRIFQAVDEMALSDQLKAKVFDYLRQPVTIEELALEATTLEQKSEVYLAASMVTGIDNPAERAYLDALGNALQLPRGLTQQLELQVKQAATEG